MSKLPEGSVFFGVKPEQSDWSTNDQRYDFDTVNAEGVTVNAFKSADRKLSITVSGLHNKTFQFTEPIPHCGPQGLTVGINWGPSSVELFLNGKRIASKAAI